MGAEEKNRNEVLSRIVAELFAKSKGNEELSSNIQRLREELKRVIEGEDTIFGKLRGLVESFREIIPEEKQRYNAAIQALSETSKLPRQEIVQAVNNQLEELKILEKVLLGTAPVWREERKVMEAKARELKDEISKLREVLGRLESEEKELTNGMATRQKEIEQVEKEVEQLFADIGAEITTVKKKIEAVTAESAVAPPTPPGVSTKGDIFPSETKAGIEQKKEIPVASAPRDTEFEKKCPMCGGRMNLLVQDKIWQCFSCAYEEPVAVAVQGKAEEKSESLQSSAQQDTDSQKKCPMCEGQMNDYGEKWQCYSCGYEESKWGEIQRTSEEKSEPASEPKPTPTSDSVYDNAIPTLSSREYRGPRKEPIQGSIQDPIKGSPPGSGKGPSSRKKPLPKKKTCPSCGKKMDWVEEGFWRCPFCDYERRI